MTNALLTALVVLTAADFALSAVSALLHRFAPTWRGTTDVDALRRDVDMLKALVPAPPPAKKPESGRARLTLLAVLALVAVLFAAAACGATARQRAINTTMTALDAAQAGFVAFDARHQLDIVSAAPDKATGAAQLATWRQTQAKVSTGLTAAWRAVAIAATVNTDQSLTTMLSAASIVEQELAAIGVKL